MKFNLRKNRETGPHDVAFKIDLDGNVLVVQHPNAPFDTSVIGESGGAQRGGYVWPQGWAKRAAFKAVRLFGRQGILADWTRTWGGPWVIVDPVLGVTIPKEYPTHAEACEAEVEYVLAGDGRVYWGYLVTQIGVRWSDPEKESHA